jgi:hypothetical protein
MGRPRERKWKEKEKKWREKWAGWNFGPKRGLENWNNFSYFPDLIQKSKWIRIRTNPIWILILSTQQYKIKCMQHEMQQGNIYKA